MSFEIAGIAVVVAILLAIVLMLRKSGTKSSAGHVSAAKLKSKVDKGAAQSAQRRSAALPEMLTDTDVSAADVPEEDKRPVPEVLLTLNLAVSSDLDEQTLERVESICANMPDPHPVQRQLASGLDTPDELMDVVSSDAGLTAGILRSVNSAAFSLASPITSVQHAITYLGVSMVKGLVAQASLAARAEEGTQEQQAALARIWKSAGIASALAQMLGQELGVARPSVIATKTLFFNLGDVALVLGVDVATAWYAESVTAVERIVLQQSACGANTAIVGSQLAREWNLPDDIAQAIEGGLLPIAFSAAAKPMELDERRDSALMYLAGRIGDRAAFHGLRDIGELDLRDDKDPELFYLPDHLEAAGLTRVADVLLDPAFRRKANRLLATLSA
ncbi:MAG: HDOD domain-containing protein [Congregibacter sp.]